MRGLNDEGSGQQALAESLRSALHAVKGVSVPVRVFESVRITILFDARGDAVEHFNTLHRIFAHGRFAAEHDGVGLFVDSIGDVGDFGG